MQLQNLALIRWHDQNVTFPTSLSIAVCMYMFINKIEARYWYVQNFILSISHIVDCVVGSMAAAAATEEWLSTGALFIYCY